MNTKLSFTFFGTTVFLSLVILSSFSCSAQTKRISETAQADISSLPAFILGHWNSIEVKTDESEMVDLQYEIVFEDKSIVKYVVIYPDSGTEGYTFTYSFINDDSIFIQNKRIRGGETWLLERKNDNLVVTRNFDNKTTIILLERVN